MQPASDKTFHLKWNNHLQNLSQLFTAIYSSSSLADVTLACRDGNLRAHKLVLSACSPYFEQIFKDNPCKHPVVILKGIPFSEINLLVEFMYKGSVDVQELDLQSLMHTASELEIRGLAYEVRANAAQLLNVNLEYPAYGNVPMPSVSVASSYEPQRTMNRTDMERLKQIHLYQQSMLREVELAKRKKREEVPTNTSAAVKNILAAAAKEMADNKERSTSCVQTDEGEPAVKTEMFHAEEEVISRPKKRVSFATPEDDRAKKKYEGKQSPQHETEDVIGKLRIAAVTGNADTKPMTETPAGSGGSVGGGGGGGIKVVNISALQANQNSENNSDDDDGGVGMDDDDSCTSSGDENNSESMKESRPHVCDICDIRFNRASHLSRHRLTHTGERPFTCGGCGKAFARSDKLRVHTKICEREDPTLALEPEERPPQQVVSGTVRITHKDSRQLMFTPSGDVVLPVRPQATPPAPATPTADQARPDGKPDTPQPPDTPLKRGRGRPKKPVPDNFLPKVKKRRGRPPKTSLTDYELMMNLNNGAPLLGVAGVSGYPYDSHTPANTVPLQQHITPSGQQLLVKRKRGRPPKNYFQPRGMNLPDGIYDDNFANSMKLYGRPNENYNATNLPFGDFSYLTEMMGYPPALYQQYHNVGPTEHDTDESRRNDSRIDSLTDAQQQRTIDLSSSSSEENDLETEEIPAAVCETEIMTVGDCQILKVPAEKNDAPSENGKLNVTSIGDCTIRPLEKEGGQ